MSRRPVDPQVLADALEAVRAGDTPAAVAELFRASGRKISPRTIELALAGTRQLKGTQPKTADPPPPPTPREALAPPPVASAAPSPPVASPMGPAIEASKLAQLAELVARLPLAQQDRLVAELPLESLRRSVVARALASHPDAGAAVARALRELVL